MQQAPSGADVTRRGQRLRTHMHHALSSATGLATPRFVRGLRAHLAIHDRMLRLFVCDYGTLRHDLCCQYRTVRDRMLTRAHKTRGSGLTAPYALSHNAPHADPPAGGAAAANGGEAGPSDETQGKWPPSIDRLGNELYPTKGFTRPDVVVRESGINGHGLFATADIPRGTILTAWSGYLSVQSRQDARDDKQREKQRYYMRVRGAGADTYVDSEPLVQRIKDGECIRNVGVGFMANASSDGTNCYRDDEMLLDAYHRFMGLPRVNHELANIRPPVTTLRSSKDISKGDELIWNYACADL
jgi:SET domain